VLGEGDFGLGRLPRPRKFPRNHHFVLGERIERNLYDLLKIQIGKLIGGWLKSSGGIWGAALFRRFVFA